MEKNTVISINESFLEAQKDRNRNKPKKSVGKRNKILFAGFFLADVVLVCAAIWFLFPSGKQKNVLTGEAFSAIRASVTGKYKEVLTEEEIEEWNSTKVQSGKVFLKLNTQIKVKSGNQAYVRLINPPYCTYNYQFNITEEGGDILYQSEMVPPGTVIQYITLKKEIGEQPVNAWVNYSFYKDGKEKLAGQQKVAATLDSSK